MANYVYSTLTADNIYATYRPSLNGGKEVPVILKKILIKGGTGINRRNLVTPMGVATAVTDEELSHLESNAEFIAHKERGFIKVTKANTAPEKVAKDMAIKDGGAQITPEDDRYKGENEEIAKPILNLKAKL